MSAVAGSVDRIASIQLAKSIKIPAESSGPIRTRLAHSTTVIQNGNPTTEPVREGSLVDGALVARSIVDSTEADHPHRKGLPPVSYSPRQNSKPPVSAAAAASFFPSS
jgi:hypothetical protein